MYRPVVFHILAAQGIDINSQNKVRYNYITSVSIDFSSPELKMYVSYSYQSLSSINLSSICFSVSSPSRELSSI